MFFSGAYTVASETPSEYINGVLDILGKKDKVAFAIACDH